MTRRRSALLPAALLLIAGAAPAQVGLFDWTYAGSSTGSGSQTPTELHVVGPDNGCDAVIAYFEATAPVGGTVSITCDFQNLDSGALQNHPDFDAPAAYLNGEIIKGEEVPPDGGWPTGTYTFELELNAGDVFGFGVWSLDCFEGPGVADYRDLVFTPEAWSSQAVGLDPRVRFTFAEGFLPTPVQDIGAADDVDDDGVPDLVLAFGQQAVVRSGATGQTVLPIPVPGGFGLTAAGVGDLDGDGRGEVLVGSPSETVGPWFNAGRARVYSGLDGSLMYGFEGADDFDRLGAEVAAIGDANADGTPDFAIQVRRNGGSLQDVLVVSGLDGSVLHTIPAPIGFQQFGDRIAGVGDVDDDGHDDLALTTNSLGVRVHSGRTGGSVLVLGQNLGWDLSVSGAGDVDGDGHDDVLVGGPRFQLSGVERGVARIFSGATSMSLTTVFGAPDSGFGTSVAGGADLDGDGRLDMAVASTEAGLGGVVEVYDALDGTLRATFPASAPAAGLGTLLDRLGDVDGDGLDDLLVFAPGAGPTAGGSVQVVRALGGHGAPVLAGTGALQAGTPFTFTLDDALPGALTWFVVGTSYVGVPFLGGVLGPSPDLLLARVADGAGTIVVPGTWPAGIPVGSTIWVQGWSADAAAPEGWSGSNAVGASQL